MNMLEIDWPRILMETMIAMAIKANSIPYSIALAPVSSMRTSIIISNGCFPDFPGGF